jgi:hypothetical protein
MNGRDAARCDLVRISNEQDRCTRLSLGISRSASAKLPSMQTFRSRKQAWPAAVSCFPSRIACGSWPHALRRTGRSRGRMWRPGRSRAVPRAGAPSAPSDLVAVRPRRRRRGKKGASPDPGLGRGVWAAGGKACLCSASRLAGSPDRGGPPSNRRVPPSDRGSRRRRGVAASDFRSRQPARTGSGRLRLRIEAVEAVLLLLQVPRKKEGARARRRATLLLLAPSRERPSPCRPCSSCADMWWRGRAGADRGHGAAARRGERRVAATAECDRGRERVREGRERERGQFNGWFAVPPGMRDGGGRLHFATGAAAPAGV